MNHQEERIHRGATRWPETPGGEEHLLERAVGDTSLSSTSHRPSLLQPQQDRNVVWRWHVRRRRPKS